MIGVRGDSKPALRSFVYACAGALLSAGAPVGLLGLKISRTGRRRCGASLGDAVRAAAVADRAEYLYVGFSTAVAFAGFGYVVGRQADQLARLSRTDALTGLTNARGLFERLDAELARSQRYRDPLALLVVDLDGLKAVNDRCGHRVGDQAIRGLADVIRSQLRSTDVAARWGGDEFVIIAPHTSAAAALVIAERIRAQVPHSPTGGLTSSIGVAAMDPNGGAESVDASAFLRAADAAMYEAKRGGRNRVALASPAILG